MSSSSVVKALGHSSVVIFCEKAAALRMTVITLPILKHCPDHTHQVRSALRREINHTVSKLEEAAAKISSLVHTLQAQGLSKSEEASKPEKRKPGVYL